jgi:hypothetical protein
MRQGSSLQKRLANANAHFDAVQNNENLLANTA